MADAKVSRINTYYSELKKLIENQNYLKVTKVCNKIISDDENEVKAWQCKIAALIHLGNFQDGLMSIKKCKIPGTLIFEKAYCEYRLNLISAAWTTISATTESSAKIKELKAQILYRLERYDDCYTIYRDIVKTTSDQFDQERLTNLAAVSVNRVINGSQEDGPQFGNDATYEQLYNKGCELLAQRNIKKALKTLEKSESVCRKVLIQVEGASDEEINEEVAVIRIQQGHCLQLLGQEKEALALYNSVLKEKPDDPALLAIINNNIVAINREGNLFDSKKRIKTTTVPGLEHKLTSKQRGSIALNHSLLAYHTNQDELCDTETNQLAKNYPAYALPAAIIHAAQQGRSGKLQEASDKLLNHAKQFPKDALLAILSAAQILLTQESIAPTVDLLLSLDEHTRYQNGIVSAIVVLCSSIGDTERASKVLREAVAWHKSNESSPLQLTSLWRQSAQFHLRTGDPQTAASSLQQLRSLKPDDRNTLAQLISAYSKFDTAMAKSLSKELPATDSLVENVDAESLEVSFGSKYAKKALDRLAGEGSPSSPNVIKSAATPMAKSTKERKKKKKRKIILPKNYITGESPDSDRWLPRWQRKSYKKKRDKRNKDFMKGTQGVSSEAADKFDITKGATGTTQPRTGHHMPSPHSESGYKRPQKGKGTRKKKH